MKAYEIMNDVIGEEFLAGMGFTVDGIKAGDENKEVKKIGVCMTATPDVIRAASEWGADLLITHEPTFYNHVDEHEDTALTHKKEQLVLESGLTIYRWHDSTHFRGRDKISEALIERAGWKGEFDGQLGFVFNEPQNPVDMARTLKEVLGVKHPRIIGRRDGMITKVILALGARGSDPYTQFRDSDFEVIISGELCEWYDLEPIRDLAQFGEQKTAIVLGHIGSERDGMEIFAESIDGKYDGAPVKYFDCGEIYTYVD